MLAQVNNFKTEVVKFLKIEPMSNEKATSWQRLTSKNLPEPNKLIWIKRKNGSIYLGYREDKPVATNEDASKDCFWHANPSYSMLMADERQLRFRHNFSDVTVDSWAEVQKPTNMQSETASLKERVRELEDLLTHATSNFEFGSEEDERWYFEREKLLTNNQQSDEQ